MKKSDTMLSPETLAGLSPRNKEYLKEFQNIWDGCMRDNASALDCQFQRFADGVLLVKGCIREHGCDSQDQALIDKIDKSFSEVLRHYEDKYVYPKVKDTMELLRG